MQRRHQVFISSTFSDLIDERAEIIQALLELDCFPAGMEMFPASTQGAWELIKGVIDDSDYYCLIVAGRYGSLDANGISFTEKEYDYAISVGKPLVAFLHADPGEISANKCDSDADSRHKLLAFRAKIEANHHCKYWTTPEDLGGKVSRAMVALRKSHPSDGWVPGMYAADENMRVEIATLRAKVAELESELLKKADEISDGLDNIASGDDTFSATIAYRDKENKRQWSSVIVSWDTILKYTGPTLLPECSNEEFLEKVNLCFFHALCDEKQNGEIKYSSVVVPHLITDQIKVQLRALGHMLPGVKRRAVADKKTYWRLSPSGEYRLLSIQAIQKPQTISEIEN